MDTAIFEAQQGDTLYFKTNIPPSATAKSFDGIIQHGEATGHAHRIDVLEEEKETIYLEDVATGRRFLRLTRPKIIRHEEHKSIEIPAGDYEVKIVREYDHFLEETRFVMD